MANKQVIEMWVSALRSGNYVQGKNCLRNEQEQFCCLGVLSDLYIKHVGGKWILDSYCGTYSFENTEGGCTSSFLQRDVMKWAGFTSSNPEVSVQKDGETLKWDLSVLNDIQNVPFDVLADYIENEYIGEDGVVHPTK